MIVSGTLGPTPPAALSPAGAGLLSDSFSPPAASTTRFHPHPHTPHTDPPKSNLFCLTILLIHHQPCDQQTSPHPPLPCDIRPPPHALCKLPAASLQHHHHPPIPPTTASSEVAHYQPTHSRKPYTVQSLCIRPTRTPLHSIRRLSSRSHFA